MCSVVSCSISVVVSCFAQTSALVALGSLLSRPQVGCQKLSKNATFRPKVREPKGTKGGVFVVVLSYVDSPAQAEPISPDPTRRK